MNTYSSARYGHVTIDSGITRINGNKQYITQDNTNLDINSGDYYPKGKDKRNIYKNPIGVYSVNPGLTIEFFCTFKHMGRCCEVNYASTMYLYKCSFIDSFICCHSTWGGIIRMDGNSAEITVENCNRLFYSNGGKVYFILRPPGGKTTPFLTITKENHEDGKDINKLKYLFVVDNLGGLQKSFYTGECWYQQNSDGSTMSIY